MLDVGDTVILFPIPADVPPHEPVNHSAVAPVPALPPDRLSVVELPLQIVVTPVIPVGAVESVLTVTVAVLLLAEEQAPLVTTAL